ncbi:MAG: flagellar biosynthetic protein FliO [Lachnospiraceae bacterium]|nr:flagellar biosynthetic protein FliO [Lachnospiraceae bacterium]
MSSILLAGSLESFIQLLGALVIFVFVIVLVYFTTKWMGGIQKKRSYNKNLRIIETIGLGNNKMVSIVEAGEVYLVVAIGKEEVHLLAQLTRDQLKDFSFEQTENKSSTESFAEIMEKLKDKLPKKQDRNE